MSRFPAPIPPHAKRLVAAAPHSAVSYAPDDAFHAVMTYSHAMDLDICHAVLKRGAFRYLGLIGSQTKRERFVRRLRELGIEGSALSRLTCPIGAGGPSSKEPFVIAIAIAAEILRLRETASTA
jgi:xanthine dehydrogenase accessory factor